MAIDRVLVVASDCAWPPNHGGRVDVWNRALAIRSAGFAVDLLCTPASTIEPSALAHLESVFDEVISCERDYSVSSFLSLDSFQVSSRRALADVSLPHNYEYAVLEGPYVEAILRNPGLRATTIDYRVHNDERRYFFNLARTAKSWLRRVYYVAEGLRIRRAELNCYNSSVRHFFISADELDAAKRSGISTHGQFLPAGVSLPRLRSRQLDGNNVLFVGSLFMPNNLAALDWYIAFVHESLFDLPDYKLTIVGNARSDTIDKFRSRWPKEKIEIALSVPDPSPFYESAALFINPAQDDAGIKVKVIEALCNGLPVISTTRGIKGSGLTSGENVIAVDDAQKFSAAVRHFLLHKDLASALVSDAQRFVAERYNTVRNIMLAYKRPGS